MHDKYLGTDKVAYGSVIHRLIHVLMPGSVFENLRTLLASIKTQYGVHDVPHNLRFAQLRFSMISKTGSVRLKGKAGEVRRLAAPLYDLFCMYSRLGALNIEE